MKRIAVILFLTGALAADTQQEEFRRILKRMDIFEVVKTAWTCGRMEGIEQAMRALGETNAVNDVRRIRKETPGNFDAVCTQMVGELKAAKVIE